MGQKLNVLIVEDHAIVCFALRALLDAQADIEVIGEASNGRDAIRLVTQLAPDLILMDLHMPDMNGIDAIAEIRRYRPKIPIVMLTFQKGEEYIRASLQAGANGYVLKDDPIAEILVAIRNVIAGKRYLSQSIVEQVANLLSEHDSSRNAASHWDTLTVRERQMLQLIAEGHTSKHIATHISRSVKTVDKHRANLMRKLDLHNVAALTQFAVKHDLIGAG